MMKNRFLTALLLLILFYPGGLSFGTILSHAQMIGTEIQNSSDRNGSYTVMPASHQLPMKVTDLVKRARMKSGGLVSEQHRQSLPIPAFRNGNLLIAFLYCPALALPKQPVKMGPPQYVVFLQPHTGAVVELKAVAPSDFGQYDKPSDMIGTFGLPEKMTADDFTVKQDRLYGLYDILLPEFALRKTKADPRVKAAAREFNALFPLLSEPPLKPYYRSLGIEYFNWVDEIAR